MPWRSGASVVAGSLSLLCVVPYIRDIVAGKTRPQRMSWMVFASLSIAAAAAQYDATGFTSGVALSSGAALGFGTVFVLAVGRGVGGGSVTDVASIVALVGVLIIWSRTNNGHLVLALVIAIEIPAVVATVHKAHRDPQSETRSTWIIDAVAGAVALAAIPTLELDVLAYPVFHTLANLSVVISIARGGGRAS